jgi:hypothetical protein
MSGSRRHHAPRLEVQVSTLQRNNVTIAGAGTRPMLFAHGYGCDENMWRLLAPAFADDYRLGPCASS